MKLADSTDIQIARDAAGDVERIGLPTRAECIRACAYSAEVASELLEALRIITSIAERFDGTHGFALDNARAAIAKATGR